MEIVILLIGFQIVSGVVLYLVLKRFFLRWFAKTGQLEKIQSEVERMLVELNHTTSANIDLMEERIQAVKEIAMDIDKRILLLRKEIDKHETGKMTYSSIIEKPVKEAPKREMPKAPVKPIITGERDRREQIMELYNAGFSLLVIANRVGTSVGEVELILSLQQQG